MAFTTKIVEVQTRQKLYCDIVCDGCNGPLKKVGPDFEVEKEGWQYLQADDALILKLEGGYGMAIDPIHSTEDELTTIFCGECTKKLCEQWPAISEIVRKNCSSSLGHECSKERKFVWRTISECCNFYCSKCGRFGSLSIGLENPADRYSRRIVDCLTGCKNIGPAIWHWEVDVFVWRVCQWSEKEKVSTVFAEYYSEDAAKEFYSKAGTPEQKENHEIWVEKAAGVSISK